MGQRARRTIIALTRVLPAWTIEPACIAAAGRRREDKVRHGRSIPGGMLSEGKSERATGGEIAEGGERGEWEVKARRGVL